MVREAGRRGKPNPDTSRHLKALLPVWIIHLDGTVVFVGLWLIGPPDAIRAAAVDHNRLAVDEAGTVAGEEQSRLSDIIWHAGPWDRLGGEAKESTRSSSNESGRPTVLADSGVAMEPGQMQFTRILSSPIGHGSGLGPCG